MAISYAVENARVVDQFGAVAMTILATDSETSVVTSFPHWLPGASPFAGVAAFAETWVADHPGDIAPFVPPTIEQRKAAAQQEIVQLANGLTGAIINRYPEAERAKWLDKEKEARAFLALDPGARTAVDAPLLAAVVAAQFGELPAAEVIGHVVGKAEAVIVNADRWTALAAFVEGFRSRCDLRVDAAETEAALHALTADARIEIDAARQAFGL